MIHNTKAFAFGIFMSMVVLVVAGAILNNVDFQAPLQKQGDTVYLQLCDVDKSYVSSGSMWECRLIDGNGVLSHAGSGIRVSNAQGQPAEVSIISCADGQILKQHSGIWACATESTVGGTPAAYTAGKGLELNTSKVFSLEVCVDNQILKRVNNDWACASLSTSQGVIHQDGTTGLVTLVPCNNGQYYEYVSGNWICTDISSVYQGTFPVKVTANNVAFADCVADGQILEWTIADEWMCKTPASPGQSFTPTAPLSLSGTDLALALCTNDEILKVDGTAWSCEADSTGAAAATKEITLKSRRDVSATIKLPPDLPEGWSVVSLLVGSSKIYLLYVKQSQFIGPNGRDPWKLYAFEPNGGRDSSSDINIGIPYVPAVFGTSGCPAYTVFSIPTVFLSESTDGKIYLGYPCVSRPAGGGDYLSPAIWMGYNATSKKREVEVALNISGTSQNFGRPPTLLAISALGDTGYLVLYDTTRVAFIRFNLTTGAMSNYPTANRVVLEKVPGGNTDVFMGRSASTINYIMKVRGETVYRRFAFSHTATSVTDAGTPLTTALTAVLDKRSPANLVTMRASRIYALKYPSTLVAFDLAGTEHPPGRTISRPRVEYLPNIEGLAAGPLHFWAVMNSVGAGESEVRAIGRITGLVNTLLTLNHAALDAQGIGYPVGAHVWDGNLFIGDADDCAIYEFTINTSVPPTFAEKHQLAPCTRITGIWANRGRPGGTDANSTWYVAERNSQAIRAYNYDTLAREAAKDITTGSIEILEGLSSFDYVTLYVVDPIESEVEAYILATGELDELNSWTYMDWPELIGIYFSAVGIWCEDADTCWLAGGLPKELTKHELIKVKVVA